MKSNSLYLLASFVSLTATLGCSAKSDEDMVGTARLRLELVPEDVQCVILHAAGAQEISQLFDVLPGAAAEIDVQGLPLGDVVFTADNFDEACAAVSASSVPTWIGGPIQESLTAGQTADLIIPMRRSGSADLTLDYGMSVDCQTFADCDDGDACTLDSCDAGVCVFSPDDFCGSSCEVDSDCDDGNSCTIGVCQEQSCLFEQKVEVGDVIVSEIMNNPAFVPDTQGEWFELYNASACDLDLNGFSISDDNLAPFVIQESRILAPGELAVLGRNADSTQNGGVNVDIEYGDQVTLANSSDGVFVTYNDVLIDSVSYDQVTFPNVPGASMALSSSFHDSESNDSGAS